MSGRSIKVAAVVGVLVVFAVGAAAGREIHPKTKLVRVPVRSDVPIEKMSADEVLQAQRFAPLLVFDGDAHEDPWRPEPVRGFICHSALHEVREPLKATDPPAVDVVCPAAPAAAPPTASGACSKGWPLPYANGAPTSCKLDLPGCITTDISCYADRYSGVLGRLDETMYVRLLRRSGSQLTANLAGEGVPLTGRAARLARVYQYWFFYPYDSWRQGSIRQAHEGDWEWAMVGVDDAGQGLFVGYSQHCFGAWQWFDDPGVRLVSFVRNLAGRTHPVLFVARGSHANYTAPGSWNVRIATCVAKRSVRSRLNTFRLNDRTIPRAAANAAVRKADHAMVTRLSSKMAWLHFAGPWGESEKVTLTGAHGWIPIGYGPAGPALHGADWDDPVALALCSGRWLDLNRDPASDHVCAPPVPAVAAVR